MLLEDGDTRLWKDGDNVLMWVLQSRLTPDSGSSTGVLWLC